jgi:hypothetical protein
MAAVPAGMGNGVSTESPFTAEATNYEEVFGQRDTMDASELIPKDIPSIYGEYSKPDPSLEGQLLMNAYQYGIDTSSAKRRWVSDARRIIPVPTAVVSPWLNPSGPGPDISRRSLGDVEG